MKQIVFKDFMVAKLLKLNLKKTHCLIIMRKDLIISEKRSYYSENLQRCHILCILDDSVASAVHLNFKCMNLYMNLYP